MLAGTPGSGPCAGNVCLSVSGPKRVGVDVATASSAALFSFATPPGWVGREVAVQAALFNSGVTLTSVEIVIAQ